MHWGKPQVYESLQYHPTLLDICLPLGKSIPGEVETFPFSLFGVPPPLDTQMHSCTCTPIITQNFTWRTTLTIVDSLQSSKWASPGSVRIGDVWLLFFDLNKPGSIRNGGRALWGCHLTTVSTRCCWSVRGSEFDQGDPKVTCDKR